MYPSAHLYTFTRDHLPPVEWQPEYCFDLPSLQFPARLNCATELLDQAVASGWGDRVCLRTPDGTAWSYAQLQQQANRIAQVLVQDMGLVPGNRVLLWSPNTPMMVASWFAVMKAGGVAVAAMPLLRAKEIGNILRIGRVSHALCDVRLADERLRQYVQNGWNVTGDAYLMDEDGYFFYQARTDDMIISAGYNIAAPDVENALMQHPAVSECAVVGVPDEERGQIVKAFVVLVPGAAGDDQLVRDLQTFVKQVVAPYKYPRAIEFVSTLPRTSTGKLQRHALKQAVRP